jgi:hypothetical protein
VEKRMNDFLDAVRNSNSEDGDDPSKERYDELKREEADVSGMTPAEQRYDELKEKAKKEMLEKEEKEEVEDEDESGEEEEFITY